MRKKKTSCELPVLNENDYPPMPPVKPPRKSRKTGTHERSEYMDKEKISEVRELLEPILQMKFPYNEQGTIMPRTQTANILANISQALDLLAEPKTEETDRRALEMHGIEYI